MLFNSHLFIFGFLPGTLVFFFALGTVSRAWALTWLILASLLFYAWWRPLNVLIIAPSIVVNFLLARLLLRMTADDTNRRTANVVLALGIAFNVGFLGYFKYTDFLRSAVNDAFGAHLPLLHIVLPLGISFITFQKIAFLVDVHAGRVRSFTLKDYCLFVLFFPQLIAGPIVHFREVMPQFRSASCRFDAENIAVGLTLFFFGLFKKAVVADSLAPLVTPIYEHAADGGGTTLLLSWFAAIGFTLQIYFDFAGYTDMALGIARCFGIRLPPNFNSPLQASSIIDFWLRWHMTLTRFLTAYIYNPLLLWLTRRRLSEGRSGLGGHRTTPSAFIQLLLLPVMLTMLISGLWHGAGYLFLVWGALHGMFITINHAWRLMAPKARAQQTRFMKSLSIVLTFTTVATAMIFFRSPTLSAAADLLRGMVGLNGLTLPKGIYEHLGPVTRAVAALGVHPDQWSSGSFALLMAWITGLLVIVFLSPNTLRLLGPFEPALGIKRPVDAKDLATLLHWRTSIAWTIATVAVAAFGILSLDGPSEFLYWQF